MQGYEQMQQAHRFPANVPQRTNVLHEQPQYQQYPQESLTQIWTGTIEWNQKIQNAKHQYSINASLLTKNVLDSTSRLVPEVSEAQAQRWPNRILLQLLSKQIYEILNNFCQPPIKELYLVTTENNQELKQALSSGV